MKRNFQRQSPDHMRRTEQKTCSRKGVCGTLGFYNEYWGPSLVSSRAENLAVSKTNFTEVNSISTR